MDGIKSRFRIAQTMEEAVYDFSLATGKKPVGFDQIKELYDKGWYGKKIGRGFYDYTK